MILCIPLKEQRDVSVHLKWHFLTLNECTQYTDQYYTLLGFLKRIQECSSTKKGKQTNKTC